MALLEAFLYLVAICTPTIVLFFVAYSIGGTIAVGLVSAAWVFGSFHAASMADGHLSSVSAPLATLLTMTLVYLLAFGIRLLTRRSSPRGLSLQIAALAWIAAVVPMKIAGIDEGVLITVSSFVCVTIYGVPRNGIGLPWRNWLRRADRRSDDESKVPRSPFAPRSLIRLTGIAIAVSAVMLVSVLMAIQLLNPNAFPNHEESTPVPIQYSTIEVVWHSAPETLNRSEAIRFCDRSGVVGKEWRLATRLELGSWKGRDPARFGTYWFADSQPTEAVELVVFGSTVVQLSPDSFARVVCVPTDSPVPADGLSPPGKLVTYSWTQVRAE
jgi:hypothetical protein